MIQFTGIEQMQANIQREYADLREKIKNVMNSIMIDIVNEAKNDPGGFNDQTGNLRNSIGYVPAFDGSVDDLQESESGEDTGKKAVLTGPSANRDSGPITGVVYAGMEYALYVEFLGGHYVIGGAWVKYLAKFESLFTQRMAAL